MAFGKWRPVIWYRNIIITAWDSSLSWYCIPGLGYLLKLFVFERDSSLKEALFNACILLWLSELPKMCALIWRNLRCPQKFLPVSLQTDGGWFKSLGILSYTNIIISILMGIEPEMLWRELYVLTAALLVQHNSNHRI